MSAVVGSQLSLERCTVYVVDSAQTWWWLGCYGTRLDLRVQIWNHLCTDLLTSLVMYYTERWGHLLKTITLWKQLFRRSQPLSIILLFCYESEVCFQESLQPDSRMQKAKTYRSGWHKLHGYKFQCSGLSIGLPVHWCLHYPRTILDLPGLRSNRTVHKWQTKNQEVDDSVVDDGDLQENFDTNLGNSNWQKTSGCTGIYTCTAFNKNSIRQCAHSIRKRVR